MYCVVRSASVTFHEGSNQPDHLLLSPNLIQLYKKSVSCNWSISWFQHEAGDFGSFTNTFHIDFIVALQI